MPNYAIPPWLAKDEDIAGKFAHGVQLGAQIQQANVAHQQQAQEAQMRMEQAAKQNEQDFYLRQQALQIQQAQHQQESALKQQQLQQAQQKIQIETQQAARQFAAQKMIDQAASEGKDIGPLLLQHYSDLYSTGGGIGQLYKAVHPQPQVPGSIAQQNIGGKPFAVITQPGGKMSLKQIQDKPESDVAERQLQHDYRMQLRSDLNELMKEQRDDTMGKQYAERPSKADDSELVKSVREAYLQRQKDIKSAMREMREMYAEGVKKGAKAPEAAKGKLTKDKAREFLKAAGGDRDKAEELARQAGYEF